MPYDVINKISIWSLARVPRVFPTFYDYYYGMSLSDVFVLKLNLNKSCFQHKILESIICGVICNIAIKVTIIIAFYIYCEQR